jgi:hypothetical protein
VPRERYQASSVLRSVFDAVEVIKKWDPNGQARFWYHYRAPMGKVCTAVCSTHLWGCRLVNFEFPGLVDPAAFRQLKGQRVLILCADPGALAKANAAMEPLGLEAHLLAEQRIHHPSVAFTMSYVAIRAKGLTEQPLVTQFEQGVDRGTLTIPAADGNFPLPLDKWHACYDSPRMSLQVVNEGLQVTTAPDRWAYALLYNLLSVVDEGDYRFDLRYSLTNGDIAFGALTEDQSRWLGQAGTGSTPPTPEKPGVLVKSFTLHLKAGESFRLLLTNNHPSGNYASRFVLHEVRAVRETATWKGGDASRASDR